MKLIALRAALLRVLLAALAIPSLGTATESGAEVAPAAFAAENQIAMNRMMAAMEIKPSGSVDRDFVAMMSAHHQGAIDMAVAELRHGSNEQLRRIAQEIIVGQQQEITAMKVAIGLPLPPRMPTPTQAAATDVSASPRPSPDGHRAAR